MKTLLVALTLLTACAGSNGHSDVTVAPEAVPYFNEFMAYRKTYTGKTEVPDNLVIEFGSTASRGKYVIGYCEKTANYRHIVLDRDFWNVATDLEKTALSAHELSHCLLNREHTTELLPDGAPKSLMYPSLPSDKVIASHFDYYIQELFANEIVMNPADSALNGEK